MLFHCHSFANLVCQQDEVAAAEPSIDEKTSKLVSKGRWSVPGYKVRHCVSSLGICQNSNLIARKNSATCRSFKRRNPGSNLYVLSYVYSSIVDSTIAKRQARGPRISYFVILFDQLRLPGRAVIPKHSRPGAHACLRLNQNHLPI